MDEELIGKMRLRYSSIHPLIFQRSVERSRNFSELFNILESFQHKYPIVWNMENRNWEVTKDLVQVSKFEYEKEGENV